VLRLGSLLQRTGGRADLGAAVRRLGVPWQRMAGVAFRTDANTHQKNTAQDSRNVKRMVMIWSIWFESYIQSSINLFILFPFDPMTLAKR